MAGWDLDDLPPEYRQQAREQIRSDVRAARVRLLIEESQETERAFTDAVRREARARDLLTYHPLRSERSEPGWPDLVIATPAAVEGQLPHEKDGRAFGDWLFAQRARHERPTGGVVFAELKRKGNYPTPAQRAFLAALTMADLDVRLWYPRDWSEILATLDALALTPPT